MSLRWRPKSRWSIFALRTCPASGSISPSRRTISRRRHSRTACRSTGLPSAASKKSTSRTCSCMLDPSTAFVDPIYRGADAGDHRRRLRSDHARAVLAAIPRFIARRAETYLKQTGIGDTSLHRSGGRSSSSSATCATAEHERGLLSSRQPRGLVEQRQGPGAELRRPDCGQARLLPHPAHRHAAGRPPRDRDRDRRRRHPGRDPSSRGRHRGPGRDRHALRHADAHGRQRDDLQVHGQERARQNGLTATFMPKPLFGDNGTGMHCHQSIWKGGKNAFYDEAGYAQLSDIGQVLHRRPAQARARAPGAGRPDDQLVPPPGAGLRGAGQPRLLAAQPLGRLPHPGWLAQPEVKAHRVPRARSVVQPVPRASPRC